MDRAARKTFHQSFSSPILTHGTGASQAASTFVAKQGERLIGGDVRKRSYAQLSAASRGDGSRQLSGAAQSSSLPDIHSGAPQVYKDPPLSPTSPKASAAKRSRSGAQGPPRQTADDTDSPEVKSCPLLSVESLHCAVEEGHTLLLRGTWLIKYARTSKSPLPRRQDLPQEAFLQPRELRSRGIKGGASRRRAKVIVVAVSHYWMSSEHPDPEGSNLQVLCYALRMMLRHHVDVHQIEELAVFLDWASLPQQPRTPQEEEFFVRARTTVYLWYAHRMTEVVLLRTGETEEGHEDVLVHARKSLIPQSDRAIREPLTGVKKAHFDKPSSRRAWPAFEHHLACLIKPLGNVHDLGHKALRSCGSWQDVKALCRAPCKLPLSPKDLAEKLRQKSVADERDRTILEELYGQGFSEAMGHVTFWNFAGMDWGPSEARAIAASLRLTRRLRCLALSDNQLGDSGISVLAEPVRRCVNLEKLDLRNNGIGPEGIEALSQVLPRCKHLRELLLCGNPVGDEGATSLATALRENDSLDTVTLTNTSMRTRGATQLFEAIREGDIVRTLRLSEKGTLVGGGGLQGDGGQLLKQRISKEASLDFLSWLLEK